MKKEKNELLEHLYKDASMATYTTQKLLDDLQEKDNKMKGVIEDILKKYQHFEMEAKKLLKKEDIKPLEEGMMTKMMAAMGINKEVKKDNSDASIADMLIKGVSMGSIEMEKKIKDYEKEVDHKELALAQEFLKFQEETIEKLKAYL